MVAQVVEEVLVVAQALTHQVQEEEESGKNNKEYIDWNTVPVDTPILVRDYEDDVWAHAYFAEYNNDNVYAWNNGGTSFTKKQTEAWCYAKLYEEEK